MVNKSDLVKFINCNNFLSPRQFKRCLTHCNKTLLLFSHCIIFSFTYQPHTLTSHHLSKISNFPNKIRCNLYFLKGYIHMASQQQQQCIRNWIIFTQGWTFLPDLICQSHFSFSLDTVILEAVSHHWAELDR